MLRHGLKRATEEPIANQNLTYNLSNLPSRVPTARPLQGLAPKVASEREIALRCRQGYSGASPYQRWRSISFSMTSPSPCETLTDIREPRPTKPRRPNAFHLSLFTFHLSLLFAQPAFAQIKIGAVSCISGQLSTFGVSSIRGARMAIEEINAKGGVLGQSIDLVVDDNGSKAGETARIARKFLSQDHVVAILGDLTSSSTMEAAPLAQEANVPLLTPTATAISVTKVGDYVFRSCFTDPFTGRVMARFAIEHLRARRGVILTDVKQDYSIGVSAELSSYYRQQGGQVLQEFSFSSGDTDFRAQLSSLKSLQPDVVFVPAYYTEAALILREARQLGIKAAFVGGEGWDSPSLVSVAGKSAEGSFYTDHFSPDDPEPLVQTFVQAYKTKYGTAPDALAALWYDGARLLVDAIRRAGSAEPAKIRDALATTKNFPGVTGNISLDERRNASKPGVIVTIANGHVKMVERVEP
jgi:branched-chain amino acid transport system substrate-binding protein